MELVDDRTPEQKETHKFLVIGTDSFMSGWGEAQGGVSYAAWACTEEDFSAVIKWVESRGDMKRIRTTYGAYHPEGIGHCHIYVVEKGHPALAKGDTE